MYPLNKNTLLSDWTTAAAKILKHVKKNEKKVEGLKEALEGCDVKSKLGNKYFTFEIFMCRKNKPLFKFVYMYFNVLFFRKQRRAASFDVFTLFSWNREKICE